MNPSKLLLAALLGLTLTPSLAAAQDVPAEPPVVADPAQPAAVDAAPAADAPVADAPPVVADAPLAEDPRAWVLYRVAFEQCAAGERVSCEASLRGLIKLYPGHSAARLAEETLAKLATSTQRAKPSSRLTPVDAERQGSNGEQYSSLARAELIAAQTIHGAVLGLEVCAALECNDERAVVGLIMLGALGGLGITWGLSDGGVTPGHSVAINSGTVWGGVNANILLSLSDSFDPNTAALGLMGGQLLGLGLGHLYYKGASPSAGQVSLANTGGIWSLVGFNLLNGALDLQLDSDQHSIGSLIAMNGGLIAGGVLAHHFPMSRGRALLLDTGGLAGLLTGMGLYVLVTNDGGEQGFYTSALLGTALGIGTSAYLTRGWDADDEDVQRRRGLQGISLVPGDAIAPIAGERQGGFGVSTSWTW